MLTVFVAAVMAVILGVAFCFLGIRTFLVLLPIWGFVAGFWLGAQLVNYMLGTGFLLSTSSIVAGLILGVIFAFASYSFFQVGVALVTSVFAAAVVNGILQALGITSGLVIALAVLAIAALAVWALLRFEGDRILVMAVTAIGGASILLLAPLLLLGRVTIDQLRASGSAIAPILGDSWLWLLAWLALAVVGFVVQYRTSRTYMFTTDDLVSGWS